MLFGLIGKSLKHSFSKSIFLKVFNDHEFSLFELENLDKIKEIIIDNKNLYGLNITFPFKSEIIRYLDYLNPVADSINAVNVIKIIRSASQIKLEGYNTDYIGFEKAYHFILKQNHKNIIILGTGSTARTVSFVLKKYNLNHIFVSRTKKAKNIITYNELDEVYDVTLIINATPVGTLHYEIEYIDLPEKIFINKPYFIDLVYNPEYTKLMKYANSMNCSVFNGLSMLIEQAKASWKIWGLI